MAHYNMAANGGGVADWETHRSCLSSSGGWLGAPVNQRG